MEGTEEMPPASDGQEEPVEPEQAEDAKPASSQVHQEKVKRHTFFGAACILMTEMCERLTYYSILAGLILYCTSELKIKQVEATNISMIFSGFVYFVPIAGGILADSYWGRYKTIMVSIGLYLIGLVLILASALDFRMVGRSELSNDAKVGLFMTGLFFVALGTGLIKANIGPFGAEQVNELGKEAVQSFFNLFYWVVNVGALVAFSVVAYIEQEISFRWGFFVPLGSMTLAATIFMLAKTSYLQTKPKGSILPTAFRICTQGCCKAAPPPNAKLPPGTEKKAFASTKKSFGGNYEDHIVDGVGSVLKVVPFSLLVIMYWAIYAQMTNTFFAQSERMDIRLGNGLNLPAAALNAFNTISIIVLIPFVDRFIYPCFEKLGKPLTYLKRMGIGMVLATSAMVTAALVEMYRKETDEWHVQVLANENFTASSASVFLQIPQFTLIGASEIFTSVTTLEFAYNQAPVNMQGLVQGVFLAAVGMGSWFSTFILSLVQEVTKESPWWGDEINDTKMEYLMFLLGAMMFINFLIFCVVAHFYNYQDPKTFKEASVEDEKNSESNQACDEEANPLIESTLNLQQNIASEIDNLTQKLDA